VVLCYAVLCYAMLWYGILCAQSKGEVVEQGPHTELIKMEGFYKTLVEKQLASAEEMQ
jgi:ABC-type transport system involved in cytochrome bd biosynthesis fused ATPase/permease subunit